MSNKDKGKKSNQISTDLISLLEQSFGSEDWKKNYWKEVFVHFLVLLTIVVLYYLVTLLLKISNNNLIILISIFLLSIYSYVYFVKNFIFDLLSPFAKHLSTQGVFNSLNITVMVTLIYISIVSISIQNIIYIDFNVNNIETMHDYSLRALNYTLDVFMNNKEPNPDYQISAFTSYYFKLVVLITMFLKVFIFAQIVVYTEQILVGKNKLWSKINEALQDKD